jgi:hypothetical protein
MAEDKKGRDWLAVGISLFALGISGLLDTSGMFTLTNRMTSGVTH